MKMHKCEYVHEYDGRWIVAEKVATGDYAAWGKDLESSWYGPLRYVSEFAFSYARHTDALKKARELYGEDATG